MGGNVAIQASAGKVITPYFTKLARISLRVLAVETLRDSGVAVLSAHDILLHRRRVDKRGMPIGKMGRLPCSLLNVLSRVIFLKVAAAPAPPPAVPIVAGAVAQHDVPIYLSCVGTGLRTTDVVRAQIEGFQ